MFGSLFLESQVFPDGFDEFDLQPAGALGVLLVAGPHPMFELAHLRQPDQYTGQARSLSPIKKGQLFPRVFCWHTCCSLVVLLWMLGECQFDTAVSVAAFPYGQDFYGHPQQDLPMDRNSNRNKTTTD